MALRTLGNGLSPKIEYDSRKAEQARKRPAVDDELTPQERKDFGILRYCSQLLRDAKEARKQHETFDDAWALFNGDVWRSSRADWRAAITINKIRAAVMFMAAVMTDNKPRIGVEPLVPGSEDSADLLRRLVDRDWDLNDMQQVLATWVLYGLIWGYSFLKVGFDPYADNGRGKHTCVSIPPYRIYANETATCIEDAEYIIHVEQVGMGWVRRNFPQSAAKVDKLRGVHSGDDSSGLDKRDYVNQGAIPQMPISSAINLDGRIIMPNLPMTGSGYPQKAEDRQTVEIAEYWIRDDSLESYERQIVKDGFGLMEPVLEGGLPVTEVIGNRNVISEIDGSIQSVPVRRSKMKPKMETAWRKMYPNGRLIVIAGGCVVLRDVPNPLQIDGFPFAMWKDYDVGSFYGQGEPLSLRSCAFAINKLASQLFEILVKTGNPSWKARKDAGINFAKVTNRPGLVIQMDDTNALVPLEKPPIPGEFLALYKLVSEGIAEVSGVNDSIRGAMPAANTSFAAVDQLTEAGSAPIRLKVRNMETGLARFGKLRIQLIQQYDNGRFPIRVSDDDLQPGVVEPASAVQSQFRNYKNEDLAGQVEFRIVPISSLSTSPAGAWNRWMQMLEKNVVDPTWWHAKWRIEGYKTELPRMLKQQEQNAEAEAALKKSSKVGGSPKRPKMGPRRLPPKSSAISAESNAAIR